MTGGGGLLRLGDDVEFHGLTYRLTGLDGDVAMLAVSGESPAAKSLAHARQQVNAILLRHGIRYPKETKWTQEHQAWLHRQRFDSPVLSPTRPTWNRPNCWPRTSSASTSASWRSPRTASTRR